MSYRDIGGKYFSLTPTENGRTNFITKTHYNNISEDWYSTRVGRYENLFYNHSCGNNLFDNFIGTGILPDSQKWEIEQGNWIQQSGLLKADESYSVVKFKYPYPKLMDYAEDGKYISDDNQYMYGFVSVQTSGVGSTFGMEFGSYKFFLDCSGAYGLVTIYKNDEMLERRNVTIPYIQYNEIRFDVFFEMDKNKVGWALEQYHWDGYSYFNNEINENGFPILLGHSIRRSNDYCDGYIRFIGTNSPFGCIYLKEFYFLKPILGSYTVGMYGEKYDSFPNYLTVNFIDNRKDLEPTKHGFVRQKIILTDSTGGDPNTPNVIGP